MTQKRRFVLHEDREDIAAGRICNATRVRAYVTLSGIRVTGALVTVLLPAPIRSVLRPCFGRHQAYRRVRPKLRVV
jgi:hypothetical protein